MSLSTTCDQINNAKEASGVTTIPEVVPAPAVSAPAVPAPGEAEPGEAEVIANSSNSSGTGLEIPPPAVSGPAKDSSMKSEVTTPASALAETEVANKTNSSLEDGIATTSVLAASALDPVATEGDAFTSTVTVYQRQNAKSQEQKDAFENEQRMESAARCDHFSSQMLEMQTALTTAFTATVTAFEGRSEQHLNAVENSVLSSLTVLNERLDSLKIAGASPSARLQIKKLKQDVQALQKQLDNEQKKNTLAVNRVARTHSKEVENLKQKNRLLELQLKKERDRKHQPNSFKHSTSRQTSSETQPNSGAQAKHVDRISGTRISNKIQSEAKTCPNEVRKPLNEKKN